MTFVSKLYKFCMIFVLDLYNFCMVFILLYNSYISFVLYRFYTSKILVYHESWHSLCKIPFSA